MSSGVQRAGDLPETQLWLGMGRCVLSLNIDAVGQEAWCPLRAQLGKVLPWTFLWEQCQ